MTRDLTKLDTDTLGHFIDEDLYWFLYAIKRVRNSTDPPSLHDVSTPNAVPLVIGPLAADSSMGGSSLITNAKAAATAIDAVLNKHQTGFEDLMLELQQVIKTMTHTKAANLAKIDAQKFLTAISGYVTDMGGSGGSASGTAGSSSAGT